MAGSLANLHLTRQPNGSLGRLSRHSVAPLHVSGDGPPRFDAVPEGYRVQGWAGDPLQIRPTRMLSSPQRGTKMRAGDDFKTSPRMSGVLLAAAQQFGLATGPRRNDSIGPPKEENHARGLDPVNLSRLYAIYLTGARVVHSRVVRQDDWSRSGQFAVIRRPPGHCCRGRQLPADNIGAAILTRDWKRCGRGIGLDPVLVFAAAMSR
jgi:hypothetical protein